MDDESACPIVGIGSSAGGIEALQGLFRSMPASTGLGFVVVAHLAPGHESVLTDILGRFTAMPVRRARSGDRVRPDHVYVIPPDGIVTLAQGRLHVADAGPVQRVRNPIDIFLSSLAEDRSERAIGIILSGAGSDGTLGIKAIKERGGLTIAQGTDHSAPRHGSMPASAIASGLIDLVLPVEAIPAKLDDYAQGLSRLLELVGNGHEPDRQAVQAARQTICATLRERVGHDFGDYKEQTFLRRVRRRMQVVQVASLEAYVDRLRGDADEVAALFRDLLIGVTHFFRDAEAFAALATAVVPRLFEGKGSDDTVRIWCPGCATGEEIYSIAILVREHLDSLPHPPKTQLFATDIDEAALQVARSARYTPQLLEGVGPERLKRWFVADAGTYSLAKTVRELCIFSAHSIIRDPPFSRVDLISCRNLLIYLNAGLQDRVIPVFHYALRPGGFLFLGGAETVTRHTELFAAVDKKNRIYRRRDHVTPPINLPSLVPRTSAGPSYGLMRRDPDGTALTLRRTIEAHVLDRLAPPHVVVNRDGDVVHYSGRTGKYLEAPAGQPSRHLLAMARKGLRLDLRTGLAEAVETRRRVVRSRIAVQVESHVQQFDLIVEPLSGDDSADPLFVVSFADCGPLLTAEEAANAVHVGGADTEELERELKETRDRLQGVIEEYETALEELKSANEELVSTNEELQSANEELETNKEELQSVNEELHTVNQDLANRVGELNQAHSDLGNLFESTRIAVAFLDRDLVLRLFTPPLTELFSLIPSDRGRPLADITSHLDYPGLSQDLRAVLTDGQARERRVRHADGHAHYLLRALPYRREGGEVDGVIMTAVDVSSVIESERQQRVLVDELNHRVRNMLTVVMAIASQTLQRARTLDGFGETFTGRIEALGRAYGLLAREQWADVALREIIEGELEPHLGGSDGRIELAGPSVQLRPKSALALGMILHELATNALKYGALSNAEGQVTITWRKEERNGEPRLRLDWNEARGPEVGEPAGRGFGSDLIEREMRHDLQGDVTTTFRPEGLHTVLTIPWRPELLGDPVA